MTTPLFLLRCIQLGISIQDLDLLTIGMINDMYAENINDAYKGYAQMDFDTFSAYYLPFRYILAEYMYLI